MANIKFIEVKDEHLPRIVEIYNYYIRNTVFTFHVAEMNIEDMKNIVYFNDNRYKSFAITQKDSIIGYCILARHKNREAYDICGEITIYLDHSHTGEGIGALAVDFIEDIAKKNKIHTLLAGICGDNLRSINLFEHKGYEKCAHFREIGKKFNRIMDVVYYQKILSY